MSNEEKKPVAQAKGGAVADTDAVGRMIGDEIHDFCGIFRDNHT